MEEIGRILPKVLRKHVKNESSPVLEVLTPLWTRVAGKAIAEQAQPVAYAAGTLTLAAACPCWARELGGMREELRAAINSALGRPVVKRLRVRHVPALDLIPAAAHSQPSAAPAERPPWADMQADLDPEIGEVLARSFAKYFAHQTAKIN